MWLAEERYAYYVSWKAKKLARIGPRVKDEQIVFFIMACDGVNDWFS
jgi:hypothetical protein